MTIADKKNFVCIGGPYDVRKEDEFNWCEELKNQMKCGGIDFISVVNKDGVEIWRSRVNFRDKATNEKDRQNKYLSLRGQGRLGTHHAYRF